MLNSVRLRLTLWYTAAMTLILIAIAASTYFVIRQNIVRRADGQAIELADSFLSTVNAEMRDSANPESIDAGVSAAISEHRFRDVVFLVFDEKGDLLGAPQNYQPADSAIHESSETLAAALRPLRSPADKSGFVRVAGHRYRSYVRHFSGAQRSATLVVLQSLREQNDFLATLAGAF